MIWGLVVLLALMIPLVAVILDSQLGRVLAARLERASPRDAEALGQRVATLEAEVERLSGEVRRLEEESRFLHRLLEGKNRDALPSGDRHG